MGLCRIWHNLESTLANFLCFWANFYRCESPYNEKINLPSGHTDNNVTSLGGGGRKSNQNDIVIRTVVWGSVD